MSWGFALGAGLSLLSGSLGRLGSERARMHGDLAQNLFSQAGFWAGYTVDQGWGGGNERRGSAAPTSAAGFHGGVPSSTNFHGGVPSPTGFYGIQTNPVHPGIR